jgi:outer membrane protein assembly factor BamA
MPDNLNRISTQTRKYELKYRESPTDHLISGRWIPATCGISIDIGRHTPSLNNGGGALVFLRMGAASINLYPGHKNADLMHTLRLLTALLLKSFSFLLILTLSRTVCLADDSDMQKPGRLYGRTIREIRIEGLRTILEDIVRSQLTSQVGLPYTEETAREDLKWLDRLKVFSSINMNASPIGDGVVLTLDVQEMMRFLPYPSINVTGENGLSAGIGVKVPSLFKRGIALSGAARFGPLTELGVQMESPWRRGKSLWYDGQYDNRDRPNELDNFQEESNEFEIKIGASVRQNLRIGGRFALLALKSDKAGITLSPGNHDYTPALGALLQYDGLDLRTNPHHGWEFLADISQNGGFLGGDGDFTTAQFDIRRYQQLAPRHVLALFSFTTLQSGNVGSEVPVYRNYHIGGTNTIRGWKNDARRGNNQFINTLEYRYELLPHKSFRVKNFGFYIGLQLAAFGDLGTAWDDGEEFTRNMIGGGGFGIRFILPFVDIIRVDFGFGESGTGMRRHFGIRDKQYFARKRVR